MEMQKKVIIFYTAMQYPEAFAKNKQNCLKKQICLLILSNQTSNKANKRF
jgi:hypothetical protein